MKDKDKVHQSLFQIGTNIARYRKSKKITQPELAKMAGISKSYMSKIERGNYGKGMSVEVVLNIASTLGMPMWMVIDGVDEVLRYEEKSKYTVKEITDMFDVPLNKLYADINSKLLKAKKEGRSWVVTKKNLDKYLEK